MGSDGGDEGSMIGRGGSSEILEIVSVPDKASENVDSFVLVLLEDRLGNPGGSLNDKRAGCPESGVGGAGDPTLGGEGAS